MKDIEFHFVDNDHIWINGRQYISLTRVNEMMKRKTNADRIRSMSDEELADLLSGTDANFPPNAPNGVSVSQCTTAWLDWLKQEGE